MFRLIKSHSNATRTNPICSSRSKSTRAFVAEEAVAMPPRAEVAQLSVLPARQSAASASPTAVKWYPGSPDPLNTTVMLLELVVAMNLYCHEPPSSSGAAGHLVSELHDFGWTARKAPHFVYSSGVAPTRSLICWPCCTNARLSNLPQRLDQQPLRSIFKHQPPQHLQVFLPCIVRTKYVCDNDAFFFGRTNEGWIFDSFDNLIDSQICSYIWR